MYGFEHGRPGCFAGGPATKLRERFRLLWLQHVYWTRMVIIAIAAGSPDLEATTRRLLRNAPDMGRLFGRFYGPDAATEITRLIRNHLTIAAPLAYQRRSASAAARLSPAFAAVTNSAAIVR